MSLDLSKAFDRVDWKSFWEALELHCVSPHLIWLLQITYANQKGQVVSNNDKSHEFDICAGVRQGCVLSPRLFCSVLQLAMGRWRSRVEHFGLNLGDGMSHLLDLRFADDILLFKESAQVFGSMLDALVTCLGQVGLKPNASKKKLLNNASATTFNIDYACRIGNWKCWSKQKRTNGLAAFYPHSTWAVDNKI